MLSNKFATIATLALALGLTACGGGGGGGGGSTPTPTPTTVTVTCPNGSQQTAATTAAANAACPAPKLVSVAPTDAATNVSPDSFVGVTVVTDSMLDPTSLTTANITLKVGSTTAIAGTVAATDGKGFKWAPTTKLNYAQKYDFAATVKDSLGKSLSLTGSFTTAVVTCPSSQRLSMDGQSCVSPPVCNPPNTLSDTWTCLPPPGLVDSGQTLCDNGSNVMAPCTTANTGDASALPRQDGRFGRDVAASTGKLLKIGGGAAGFDYSKISNNGNDLGAAVGLPLGANPNDWACTRDNMTGLTWEVKVNNPAHLRHMGWIYQWYNSDPDTNGGNPGVVEKYATGWCKDALRCDTEKYVADVNKTALCGYTDWRLPTARELLTLADAGKHDPAIDEDYFPNTSDWYHTATTFLDPIYEMTVNFSDGGSYGGSKDQFQVNVEKARLVRGPAY
jgi:hypothetical protein